MSEVLPWLNLLLLPAVGLLMRVSAQLATLAARQEDHARRLDRLESNWAALARDHC
jgi:hypothetical protein